MNDSSNNTSILQVIALISQLGLVIAMPIVGSMFLGKYLDQLFDTGNVLTIVLMLLGIVSGFQGAYRLIMRAIKSVQQED